MTSSGSALTDSTTSPWLSWLTPWVKSTKAMANLGTSLRMARRMALICEASVSLMRYFALRPLGQPFTVSMFMLIHLVQTRRPRRPPFFFVPSWAMGVTSSIRVIVMPARVRARMAA